MFQSVYERPGPVRKAELIEKKRTDWMFFLERRNHRDGAKRHVMELMSLKTEREEQKARRTPFPRELTFPVRASPCPPRATDSYGRTPDPYSLRDVRRASPPPPAPLGVNYAAERT